MATPAPIVEEAVGLLNDWAEEAQEAQRRPHRRF
jgi:hypothetical protein